MLKNSRTLVELRLNIKILYVLKCWLSCIEVTVHFMYMYICRLNLVFISSFWSADLLTFGAKICVNTYLHYTSPCSENLICFFQYLNFCFGFFSTRLQLIYRNCFFPLFVLFFLMSLVWNVYNIRGSGWKNKRIVCNWTLIAQGKICG